jgi:molecular chaperone GrpE
MTGNNHNQEFSGADTEDVLDPENIELETQADEQSESAQGEDQATTESLEEGLQQQLQAALLKAEENLELAQLTQAEMENLRKRTIRDIENAHKYALDRFVNELLPVIDSFELGVQAADEVTDPGSLQEGMNLTLKKLLDVLEKFGVAVVDPAGEKFNPDKHDAVSMAETDEHESGTVMSVLQKGYELNGRLVRPAMVVVSK